VGRTIEEKEILFRQFVKVLVGLELLNVGHPKKEEAAIGGMREPGVFCVEDQIAGGDEGRVGLGLGEVSPQTLRLRRVGGSSLGGSVDLCEASLCKIVRGLLFHPRRRALGEGGHQMPR